MLVQTAVGLVHRTTAAASVRQRLSPPLKLVWLSDAVMRSSGARTTRRHDRTSSVCVCLSFSWYGEHASRSLHVPVTASVGMRLLPPRHSQLHGSHTGVRPHPARPVRILPPLQDLPVYRPCVLFPHRWEGRSPRALETTCKWIVRMPLIWSQSQSAADHLRLVSGDGDMHSCVLSF